ncbi:flagellar export protein FliJ [Parahaliea mediterranea]|uniref:Flagellar FliJ protein n=1 Tax=Parahaliea mediterranea TaxID=651086 RepID=A0A939DCX3_9GAMM|nr:flagellar export protein FliJ [Parahaliea mediterranea]MBN7795831.1 flagellar export protein FliJ [Parahaliea mediterranea]
MNRGKPLDTLIELARKARDGAGKALAQERQQSRQTAMQLDTLRQYRREYASQMQIVLQGGTDAATLANYRDFLQSLDAAIERAGQALEQQEKRVDNRREHWRQEQRKLSSYDTLAERRAQRERSSEQRREMLQNDEFVTNLSARTRLQSQQPDQ